MASPRVVEHGSPGPGTGSLSWYTGPELAHQIFSLSNCIQGMGSLSQTLRCVCEPQYPPWDGNLLLRRKHLVCPFEYGSGMDTGR